MSTPEGKVKKVVKSILERGHANLYYFMPVQGGYGKPGLDYHGCCRGVAFAIETKAPGRKLTPRQEATKREMEAAGMKVFVIGETEIKDEPTYYKYSGTAELEAWLLGLLS